MRLVHWIHPPGMYQTRRYRTLVNRRRIAATAVVALPYLVASITAVVTTATAVQAQTNLISNGSFETASIAAPTTNVPVASTAITGWIVTRAPIDYVGSEWIPSDGVRSIDLDGTPGAGGIAQSFATVNGQAYTVLFDLSGHPVGPPTIKSMTVTAAGQSALFTFDVTGRSEPNDMGWITQSLSFTATGPLTTLEFFSNDTSTGTFNGIPLPAYGPAIDNVRVFAGASAAAPESGTLALLALAGVPMIGFVTRRRR
jgi:choice-of-anchor C domain-containing protein